MKQSHMPHFFFYSKFKLYLRFHVDVSKDQLVLGGFRDWLIFAALESVMLLVFLLMYIIFLVWCMHVSLRHVVALLTFCVL